MKKYLLLFVTIAAIFSTNSVKAQLLGYNERYSEYQWHISVGADGMYNMNPGKNYYTGGLGGTIKAQYDLTQNLGLTLSTGYYQLFADKSPTSVNQHDLKYIPLKFGAKAYFLPEWYLGGEVGAGYADPYIDANSRSHFSKVIAPAIGYETNHLDVALRYENMHHHSDYVSIIALRVAYIFNF